VTDIEIDLTGALDDLRFAINPFKGNVDYFNMQVNGQTENVLGDDGVKIPSIEHGDDDDFVGFTVEADSTDFTAGEEDVDIVAGEILAQIGTTLVGDLPATCNPDGDGVIATVKVEEPGDGNGEEPEEPEEPEDPEDPEDP